VTERIGIDTNVAIRWLFQDDSAAEQSQKAEDAVAEPDTTLVINTVVLAEIIWLAGQTYKLGRASQANLIRKLLAHPSIDLLERAAVIDALTSFERGGAGFTDHLIGTLNARAGCRTTLTFDKTAARGPLFTPVG
jgi:predicted nucleic-acid-binding protein